MGGCPPGSEGNLIGICRIDDACRQATQFTAEGLVVGVIVWGYARPIGPVWIADGLWLRRIEIRVEPVLLDVVATRDRVE